MDKKMMICPKNMQCKKNCLHKYQHEFEGGTCDGGYRICPDCIPYVEPSPEPSMPLIESPQNPYPEDIFTFTIEDYVKAIPDAHLRTGISGAVGRYVFNFCCEDWQKLIAEWLPAHDLAVRKALVEEVCKLLDDELRIISPNTEAKLKAHLRAMAGGER